MPSASSKPRILLVEDFEDSRSVLKRLLEIEGFEVMEASDGRQAIETALREALDLILMDVSLPAMDGFQATRQIRALEQGQTPPIIVISAYDNHEIRAEAKAAGCTDYVTKPIDFDQLLKLIKKYTAQDDERESQAASIE